MKLPRALLVGLVALAPVVGAAAPARASQPDRYRIELTGPAQIADLPFVAGQVDYRNTRLDIAIAVTCPLGQTVHVPYAGLPTFWPDSALATPHLPRTAELVRVDCTGRRVHTTAHAYSIHRGQNPAVDPFRRFTPGTRLVVQVALYAPVPTSDLERVKIVG